VEPLTGRRHVDITEHRTRKDWAVFVKGMLDEWYPQATKVRLVMDNLNTHSTLRFIKPSNLRKRSDWLADRIFTTRPSTAVGSMSLKSN
jgi:hypothetical protein